jgi:ABC-2 type transport system ATP-binding protein
VYRGELIALGTPEHLKTEHMKEAVLELDCARPNEALGVLEGLPGIREVALFGRGLHVVTPDSSAAEQVIRKALTEAKLSLNRIESIPPSLEDVFVSLIEQRDRSSEPQTTFKQ